jgi:hypothetical protein
MIIITPSKNRLSYDGEKILRRNGSSISVVLLENMEKRGIVGDIVQVKRGFARNFLIPRKKAGNNYWRRIISYVAAV